MKQCYTIEKKDDEVWIVDNTTCHIDGEPFKYKQVDECRAKALSEVLNELHSYKQSLKDIMEIIHNITYGEFEYTDLENYIYKGVNIEDIHYKYDDIARTIKEMNKNED